MAGVVGCAVIALGPQAMSAERGPVDPRDPTVTERNKMLAVALMTAYGWSDRQWRCLDRLWTRESSWNHLARNRGSGAYGIPQALPGSKMATAGSDWKTNPATQIKWGLSYIKGRYHTPCEAWAHSQNVGWY